MSPDPLTTQEEAAWRALVRLMVVLPRAIDDDLSHRAGMGLTTYVVLMNLSESPGHELRMRDLAERSALSPSRMTRVVDALERDGLVVREPSTLDQRTTLARLTGAGLHRLQEAWPAHLAGARALVMDHLGAQELSAVTVVLRRLIDVVERSAATRP